jgi:hypothetical protein
LGTQVHDAARSRPGIKSRTDHRRKLTLLSLNVTVQESIDFQHLRAPEHEPLSEQRLPIGRGNTPTLVARLARRYPD